MKCVVRILTLLLAAADFARGQTPNDQHRRALRDLAEIGRVDPSLAARTRYIDLADVPEAERSALVGTVAFVLNSLSWRSTLANPAAVDDDSLLRIDLASLGWDRTFRYERLAMLEGLGVRFNDRNRLVDIWEVFAAAQPHFKAPQDYGGRCYRGWIDPENDCAARKISYSCSFIIRASWLLPRLMLEKELGGFYSDTLLLPDDEGGLYKVLSVDIKRFDAEDGFRRGTFRVNGTDSYVAVHNRGLEWIKTPVGLDVGFLSRTYDVADDSKFDKRVLNALAGDLALDGREIIFTLPNGLHGYRLSNGQGKRVAEVPPNIAQDKRSGSHRERRVLTAYKCVDCHGHEDGLIAPGDQARKMLVDDARLGFQVKDADYRKAELRKREIEEYYLVDLIPTLLQQRASYRERIKAVNGLSGGANAESLVRAVEGYLYDPVGLETAAREVGATPEGIAERLRPLYGEAAVLSRGNPIPRPAWDAAFDDAMLAKRYPWDK